jgi:hypothetical protein
MEHIMQTAMFFTSSGWMASPQTSSPAPTLHGSPLDKLDHIIQLLKSITQVSSSHGDFHSIFHWNL